MTEKKKEKKDVGIKDLPKTDELKEKDLDKVSGGLTRKDWVTVQ